MTAYAVLAHDDPLALKRLVTRLRTAPVHVHLDGRVDLASFESVAQLRSRGNVRYVQDRVKVNWGGYSVVEAMLKTAEQALPDIAPTEHVVFLSGHCYPVRTTESFEHHLREAAWQVHARSSLLMGGGSWHTDRYQRNHGFDGRAARSRWLHPKVRAAARRLSVLPSMLGRRKVTSLDVVAGSQWMAIPGACMEEAITAIGEPPFAVFRNSFAPDEMLLQTFIYNSQWKSATEFGGVEAPMSKVAAYPNFHQLDLEMRGAVDPVRALSPSPREFFARKFNSRDHVNLMGHIDERLGV